MSRPILQVMALRAIETRHADAQPSLMERAGSAAAQIANEMLADNRPGTGWRPPPLIVAGPGNNGGDAFVVARLLKAAGHAPRVLFVGDAAQLPDDARAAHANWLAAGGQCRQDFPAEPCGLIVDGLFGIGIGRPIEGPYAEWIERINARGCPVLALDIPSGLNAETGQISGPCVRATRTATFIALKPGLLTADGPDHCGDITLCGLDLVLDAPDGREVAPALFQTCLRSRQQNTHKGSFGSVAIIGGAPGMAGAALLAGRAALKLGAGRVYLGLLEQLLVDPIQPELMVRSPEEVIAPATILAIGPGLGHTSAAAEYLLRTIESDLPLVIDADALNLLAKNPTLRHKAVHRLAPTLLTPHPAEAARLLGITPKQIQADRLAAALALARMLRAHVALKGCGTIIASPDGDWFINTTGNPGLATAGSGDILTGMLAALLAQNGPPLEALLGAVHLHGAAADACVEAQQGPCGLSAGELIDPARRLLNDWIKHHGPRQPRPPGVIPVP